MKGKPVIAILLLLLTSLSFSQMSNISTALASLCDFFVDLLPVVSMLVIVAGGAVYAGGQLMGAETRARANVWATALLMGALIGILISVLGPFAMQTMYGSGWTTACQGSGGGGGGNNCGTINCAAPTTCCGIGNPTVRCCGGDFPYCCAFGYINGYICTTNMQICIYCNQYPDECT